MNSYHDYKPGSATVAYRQEVDQAAAIAEAQKARVDPMYHEKIDRLLDKIKGTGMGGIKCKS